MDEVELLLIQPQIFSVVNDEFEIGRDAVVSSVFATRSFGIHEQCWLARTQINAGHLAIGECIGCDKVSATVKCIHIDAFYTHVHGPDASAGANIKGIPWILHRREEKLAVEGEVEQVVLQIQSIRLALRRGQRHRPDDRISGLKHGVPRRSERCISRPCTLQACQHQALGFSRRHSTQATT